MSLQVLVNGFDVTNGVTHFLNYRETEGLFDPAALVDPEMVDTFEGPFRVRQTTTDYGMRSVKITGRLNCRSLSYADKLRALDSLQAIYAPRPSRVVVGTLELQVDFGRVQISADEMKRLSTVINYTVEGTAIPATFACTYGAGTGLTQGIPVDTQRVNEAATLATMASGVGTITCLGDVPTPAVLTIQNNPAAVKVYYLATSATGRRVPISTDANGVGRIDERAGLYLAPGVNRITAYQAATGAATFTDITVMSFYGTTWRYSGNAVAGNATRFDLGPALTVNRTGSARVFRGNTNPSSGGTNGIVTAGDDEPRIGWAWLNRRNIIVNSLNIFTGWTSTLPVRNIISASEPFGYNLEPRAVATMEDTSTASIQTNSYLIGSLGAVSYVASVYILKDSDTTRRAGFFIQTTGGLAYVMLNTSTGVGIRANNSTGTMTGVTVAVSDEGLWWRLSATWTGEAANTLSLAPAIGPTSGNDASITTRGSAVFACPQVEIGTTPSPYQATDASGIAIDHPANRAGLVLEGLASNLSLYSEDIQSSRGYTFSPSEVSFTNGGTQTGPDGSATSARRWTAPATGDNYITSPAISVSNGSATTYTASVWLRAVSGVQTINIYGYGTTNNSTPATATACVVNTNWTRFTVTWTAQPAVTAIKLQIGGGSTWNNSFAMDIYGVQIELGSAATSYIKTEATSVRREADICGVMNPHNLLTYSEDFDNAAWVKGSRITVTANNEEGPDGIKNSDRVVLAAGTGTPATLDDLRLAAPSGTFETGKPYTLSCWVKTISGSPTMRMFLNQSGPAALAFVPTTSWQRFVLTYIPTVSTSDGWTIDFNNSLNGFTVAIYGAQVTEGYLPGRYVRTTDTAVLPTTAIDPSWSQNGYIEFDAIWAPRASGTGEFLGDTSSTTIGGFFFRSDKSGNWVVFSRRDTGNTNRNVLYTSATVHDRGYGKIRAEWTNYTLSGNRFMYLRIYVDGVLGQEINYAGTAGTAWPIMSMTSLSRMAQLTSALGSQGTISNLTLGVPTLPQGAVPAGI